MYKKSRFTVDIPIANGADKLTALYHTMTGAFVLIPEAQWSEILNDPEAEADPETIELLREQGFLVKEDVDETALFDYWKQQQVHDFSTLTSKVLVTRKCNTRCRYCILDPEAKDMSPETALAMDTFYIDTIKEKRSQKVKDDYLGGEPLLNTDIVLESAARRFEYCEAHGIEYSFTITTNGTLLNPSIIQNMKKVGLTGIRVSMAGPQPIHDHLRPSKNGGKTYDTIMKNLQAISGMVPITIECQYDSGTPDYRRIPEMMDDFKKRDIAVKEINFTPILARRGDNPFDSGMGDPEVGLWLMREAQKRGYLQEREAPCSSCMADYRCRFVFDTDGSILPCPSVQGGEMAYGHVTKEIDFVAESQLLKRHLPDRCLNKCELLPICNGGCRFQALVHENDFSGIDCHYDTYRIFLEDYIKDEARAALDEAEVNAGIEKAA